MFELYKLTEKERKIEAAYKERNITSPEHLDIHYVAKAFNIHIEYSIEEGPQRAIWDDEGTSVIFLKEDSPEITKREIFFHEFSHPTLHCGDQTVMKNKAFRDLQEYQANQFQLYAAIPFFMLKELKLPMFEYQIIQMIQKVFKVSSKLARKRFEQIKRRIIQSQIDNGEFVFDSVAEDEEYYNTSSFPSLEDLFTPGEIGEFHFNRKPKRKKNIVYYDVHNGIVTPLWYVIDIHKGDVNWGKPLKLFPIDASYDFLPIKEFQNKDSDAPVSLSELVLNPSKPNDFGVNLKDLKEKLMFFDVDPYNVRRFVIPVDDLEKFLQLPIVNSKTNQIKNTNYQYLII